MKYDYFRLGSSSLQNLVLHFDPVDQKRHVAKPIIFYIRIPSRDKLHRKRFSTSKQKHN